MSDQRIQEVLAIEEQAKAVRDAAVKEADEMPRLAQRDAQAILDKTRAEAEAEAKSIVDKARSEETQNKVMSEFEANAKRTEELAMSNFDRAVSYVLCSVVGR
jgi:vacuolar-type H+-ATPase subunit H